MVKLTDNSYKDMSTYVNTTISVANSAQVSNKFTFGPSPSNLFTFTNDGYNGQLQFKADFAGCSSTQASLTVSSQVMKVKSISSFKYQDLNDTFSDFEKATRQPYVDLVTEDDSTIRVENFTLYSGLLKFSISKPSAVTIDATSGVITLVSNDNQQVVATATSVSDSSVKATFGFYSNPKPSPGQVDIGEEQGPAVPLLTAGKTWKMPVTVNPGSAGIQAVHVVVEFDTAAVEVSSVETAQVYDVTGNTLKIFSTVSATDAMKTDVAMVTFKALKSDTPSITLMSYRTVDKKLVATPSMAASSCPNSVVSGDINLDCAFDVRDVAFVEAYRLSAQNGFSGELGDKLKAVTTSQKSAMDVDFSQAIDEDDSKVLANVFLERARFLTDLNILIPDHNRKESTSCEMSVQIKLKSKSGQEVDSSETQVYLDIAHTTAAVHTQVHETSVSTGSKAAMKNNQTFFGGIFKASYDSQTKAFTVASVDSKLLGTNIGMSVIQVVTNEAGQKVVSPMFKAPKSISYQSGLDINLETSLNMQYKSSYSPQRMVDFEETTERCKDPYVTDVVEITFKGDFSTLTAGGDLCQAIEKALHKLGLNAEFKCTGLRQGSIIATLEMKTIQSQKSDVTASLYSNVVKGISVTHNAETIVTEPQMSVGGKEYVEEKEIEKEGGLSTTHIIIIVISMILLIVMIIAIIFFVRYRNNKKIVQTPPVTPDNCWTKEDDMEMKKQNMYFYEVNPGFDRSEDAESIESVDATIQVP